MNDVNEPAAADTEMSTLQDRNRALELEVREARETGDRRLIHAELKNLALRSGLIDLDGLKLADSTAVRVDENGDVSGAARVISRLQSDKPWLFAPSNSSSLANVPPSSPATHKLATEMTLEEWRSARADLVRRR